LYEGLSDVKITVEPPSQAERLEACQKTIQIKSQPLSPRLMRVSLQLICPQPRWTIALSAEVSALQQSYRARRLIAKGEAIQAIDFLTQNLPAHQVPRHAITSLKHFDDAIAARDITPNSLLTQRHIDYPILVERNDKVTLVFTNEKIQIKTQGIALRAAKKNEKIQVRNINSNKIITGYVRARGLVEVP
jgi:flagella basal body P-ring formation protein FlgA